jgi:hypothetical protein
VVYPRGQGSHARPLGQLQDARGGRVGGEVHVAHRPPHERVAHGAPHDPGAVARVGEERQRRGGLGAQGVERAHVLMPSARLWRMRAVAPQT